MVLRRVLVALAFAALVCANEVEDSEQKKRGAGKSTSLNAIPTGAQKPEYTYSIYPQSQTQTPTYQQPQVSSFYPNQANQYYTSGGPQPEQPQYSQQPQLNLIPPPSSSQFVPYSFAPNPGYQKFQLVPSKTQNGIQLTLIPQPALQNPVVYPQQFFNPGQVQPQQNLLSSLSPQQFNVPNYQLPTSPFAQPSMLLFSQPNSLYNNLLYQNPNPVQSVYNHYPSSQPKYVYTPQQSNEPSPPAQATPKEDNDINTHSTEYLSPSDNYKSSYRGPYSKV